MRLPKPALNGDATALLSGAIGSGQDAAYVTGYCKRTDYRLQTDPNASSATHSSRVRVAKTLA